jgi:hypothetical protein
MTRGECFARRGAAAARILGAAVACLACACGSGKPADASATQSAAARAPAAAAAVQLTSTFADNNAARGVSSCRAHPEYDARLVSWVLGRPLSEDGAASVEDRGACSLSGDNLRVRFVPSSTPSWGAARSRCQSLAGPGARVELGPRSESWIGADGVYTVHDAQCTLTQIFENGALDLEASVRVAREVAWHQR